MNVRLIKRYSNRRLYDVESSRTITQTELAAMIRNGVEVKIVDSSSEEDITLEVLGRVLVNETSSWNDLTESQELFRQLIISGGDKSMSVLKNTVLASIGAFEVTKAKAEKIIDELIKKGELDKSDRKKAVMEMLEKTEESTAKLKDKIVKGADKTQKEVQKFMKNLNLAKKDDLQKLTTKVDKLAKSLKAIEKKLNEL